MESSSSFGDSRCGENPDAALDERPHGVAPETGRRHSPTEGFDISRQLESFFETGSNESGRMSSQEELAPFDKEGEFPNTSPSTRSTLPAPAKNDVGPETLDNSRIQVEGGVGNNDSIDNTRASVQLSTVHPSAQAVVPPPAPPTAAATPTIETIDSTSEGIDSEDEIERQWPSESPSRYAKKPRLASDVSSPAGSLQVSQPPVKTNAPALHRPPQQQRIQPGVTFPDASVPRPFPPPNGVRPPVHASTLAVFGQPEYIRPSNPPTWRNLLSPGGSVTYAAAAVGATGASSNQRRVFRLSLLNVNEFTITGLPGSYGGLPTPVTNLRTAIRQISRDHGKAVFERNKDDTGGKWRIPLGAYRAFVSYLTKDRRTEVEGIPRRQLEIASLEKARQEKGYPTYEEVVQMGVPPQLARALAPFQRGGVGFAREKDGRALIADDMGLGKTIQGIAAMTMYSDEWPLLVLCPSSARYHWASEFRHWLGQDKRLDEPSQSPDFNPQPNNAERQISGDNQSTDWKPLQSQHIVVLMSSKDPVMHVDTRVVVCSYGLAPALIESNKITPGLFKCAIVDESHMLKNKNAKRTQSLIPILQTTKRCLLLSGTPALAKPAELWPQLEIIGTARYGWWEDERQFMDQYAKNASTQRRAELHTLLTGTVMIRRLKPDILKTLPPKIREKASVRLLDESKKLEFKDLLMHLKESRGALGKIARREDTFSDGENDPVSHGADPRAAAASTGFVSESHSSHHTFLADAESRLHEHCQRQLDAGRRNNALFLQSQSSQVNVLQLRNMQAQLDGQLQRNVERQYREGLAEIMSKRNEASQAAIAASEKNRKHLLTRLYALTGNVKIPLVVDMLDRWIKDPTKGKVCVFAHHISVLDGIAAQCKLSNGPSSQRKFIRIDGSTSPRMRQEQIDAFQSDPSIRVALLGITAAGVAVTLTAASTVWFAELFWTPALMIQAEDRAHRIGQASRVRCLYLVAKGTLDEVLWKLIEKKFQDLGEFVEGQERLKMVIHKEYKNEKELLSIFQTEISKDEEEDDDFMDEIMMDDLFADEGIEHDIMSLGEMEREMAKDDDADEDEKADGVVDLDQKPPAIVRAPVQKTGISEKAGTKENAIALSSDEESDGEDEACQPTEAAGSSHTPLTEQASQVSSALPSDMTLENYRMYRVVLPGPSIGVSVTLYHGRIVVKERSARQGANVKPAIGDVFAAVNNRIFPYNIGIVDFQNLIAEALARPPVQLVFVEIPEIRRVFTAPAQKGPAEVIEIDDSSDEE